MIYFHIDSTDTLRRNTETQHGPEKNTITIAKRTEA